MQGRVGFDLGSQEPGTVEVEKLSDYVRISKAADYLGISPNTLRSRVNAGKIAAARHPVNDFRHFKPVFEMREREPDLVTLLLLATNRAASS